MRVSREAAQASRKRIIQEAARLMREKGVGSTSVADVMGAAGMTTGGFYKHFESKDDLAAAAVGAAFESILAPLQRSAEKSGPAPARAAYLRHYLSEAHVRNPGKGCPVAAMGVDGGSDGRGAGSVLQAARRHAQRAESIAVFHVIGITSCRIIHAGRGIPCNRHVTSESIEWKAVARAIRARRLPPPGVFRQTAGQCRSG